MSRKIDKYIVAFRVYLMLVIVSYVFFYLKIGTSEFQKSFSFIREHFAFILLLLWIRSKLESSDAALLLWGIIAYKGELILYNILLIFVPKKHEVVLNTSYDVVLCLTFTILATVLFCHYFDKIISLMIKTISLLKYLPKWIKR